MGGLTHQPHRLPLKFLGIPTSSSCWHGHLRFHHSPPYGGVCKIRGGSIPCKPISINASLTSSNLNGCTMASIIFMSIPPYRANGSSSEETRNPRRWITKATHAKQSRHPELRIQRITELPQRVSAYLSS